MTRLSVFALLVAWAFPAFGAPQSGNRADGSLSALTLEQAIQYATDHYPAIRVALEGTKAATAGVGAARSAYLPRLDALWQSNRGTANNVFGQVLPQSVLPALTGPVLPAASTQSVWGSATGALLSWEAFDFGLRRASVAGAEAAVTRARAEQSLTRLEVQTSVAQAFLVALAAERAVRAAQADLERRTILLRSVQALVDNQLRPGFDASRALAERAAARTRLARSEEAVAVAEASLAQALGLTTGNLTIAAGRLLERLPPEAAEATTPAAAPHPAVLLREAALEQARTEQSVLARTNLPHIVLQSSVFGRGSGANPDGAFDPGVGGLGLARANWAAGVQVVIPNLFGFAALGARKAAAAATTRASAASYDEAVLQVSSEQRAAAALLRGAREVAADTPVQLAAARETENRARARYDAGLASIVEVAEAQGLLAQAELEDEMARVDVWRALLASAAARGDLAGFVDLVR